MKLLFSPSSLLSVEDMGLLPRFMKCNDMARSSSWASTAEPKGTGAHEQGHQQRGEGCFVQQCQVLPSIPPQPRGKPVRSNPFAG